MEVLDAVVKLWVVLRLPEIRPLHRLKKMARLVSCSEEKPRKRKSRWHATTSLENNLEIRIRILILFLDV